MANSCSKWAYYNDSDPQKCEWVRELIKRGLVTDGEVDERPIQLIQSDDLKAFQRCHFFCGVAIWDYSLRCAGWPEDREIWTGSCPCQPFSAAGKGEAFNDERHLWPEFFRLIKARRPLVVTGEQVASIDGLAWLDLVQSNLDDAKYTCGAVDLCAAGFGAPHRRQRLYWMAHPEHAERWSKHQEHRDLHGRNGSGRGGDTGVVGDTGRAGLEVGGGESGHSRQEFTAIERTGNAGGMENPLCSERWPDQWKQDGHRKAPCERGPVNGFWGSADWVLTRPQRVGDRPGLRPVESKSQQMVDGFAEGVGPDWHSGFPLAQKEEARISRLRGYGDGIVAPVAEAFIRAYMELDLR